MENFRDHKEIGRWQTVQRKKKYIVRWIQFVVLMVTTAIAVTTAIFMSSWLTWIVAVCVIVSFVSACYLIDTGIPPLDPKDKLLQSMRSKR